MTWFPCFGRRHREVLDRLDRQQHQLERIERMIVTEGKTIMAGQADIDAAVAAISTAVADLGVQVTAIQAGQAALDAAIATLEGEGVDTSELVAASAQLSAATGQLDSTVSALTNDPNVPPAA